MRSFPPPTEYGSWDVLPDDPADVDLDLTSDEVKDALERRETLKLDWYAYRTYPHGIWSQDVIDRNSESAEAWRNWVLRRSWEGITHINGCLLRWSRAM